MVLDFVDAFHTLGIHPDERPFQIISCQVRLMAATSLLCLVVAVHA